jgi:GPH family glycoside/pentoside/hexuronide:cation symporter
VADVVDHDEAIRGVHREGLYFGFWRMGSKLARALGLAVAGFLLEIIGFSPGAAEQAESV